MYEDDDTTCMTNMYAYFKKHVGIRCMTFQQCVWMTCMHKMYDFTIMCMTNMYELRINNHTKT